MLGAAPRTLGAGELYRLWRGRLEGQCIHGDRRPLASFMEFWTGVEDAVGVPRAAAERTRSDFEAIERFNPLRVGQRSFEDYRRLMLRLFSALGERGYEYVIDSSKNSWATAYRPACLRACGLSVYFVHLQRSFRSTMRSIAHGSNRELLGGRHDPFRLPRNAVGFHLAHAVARQCRADGRYLAVPFEQLMRHPAPYISRICEAVGMEAEPILEKLALGEPFRVGHQVGGNRLLKDGEMIFRHPTPSPASPPAAPLHGRHIALDRS